MHAFDSVINTRLVGLLARADLSGRRGDEARRGGKRSHNRVAYPIIVVSITVFRVVIVDSMSRCLSVVVVLAAIVAVSCAVAPVKPPRFPGRLYLTATSALQYVNHRRFRQEIL